MATSSSNVSNIANIIVGSDSDSESSDDENDDCESLVSDLNSDGENEAYNEQGGNETPESTTVPSLLDVLRAPKLSEINRKRKTYSNTRGGKRRKARSSSSSASEPKNIQPQQRLKQYPNEPFDISAGKLFCKACREELSLKSSSLSNHIKSSKHRDGKVRLEKKEIRERDISKQLSHYNQQAHLIGETLPQATQVYRVKVVTAFLRAAVPLSKLEHFRELFEEGGYRLTDRRHTFDLIPFIQKQEVENVRNEISSKKYQLFLMAQHTWEKHLLFLFDMFQISGL